MADPESIALPMLGDPFTGTASRCSRHLGTLLSSLAKADGDGLFPARNLPA
jgi:hypothetical protein